MTETAQTIDKTSGYGFPSRAEALILWENGIRHRLAQPYGFPFEGEYRFHTKGVAAAAEKIAAYTPKMDSEKAYILGLLHDYGKRISEKQENRFHGQEGYEEMLKLGYPEIARVCLTHTFPVKNFRDSEFSYPDSWIKWVRKTLSTIEYDDYDYLICLCDKFFEGMAMVSIEKRVKGIVARYGLDASQEAVLVRQSAWLKEYFERKTGRDIYDILGIEE